MKKITMYTMVLATSISCLMGCGSEKNIKSLSMVPCESPAEEETKCYHENTDSMGICLDCGEEAGVIIGREEFYAYFDILMQPKRGYVDGYDIVIAPRSGYENATFENVCVTVYGTKLAHDGFSRNRDCELASIFLDEKGTGSFSGFINNYISADYIEVGPCFIGAARVHLNGSSSAINDDNYADDQSDEYYVSYEESENKMPDELVIKEDEFYKFFDMVDTGLHVDISPSDHYWGCKFTNCQAIIQGYLGTQFKDLGYVDINERGFGRAEWYGLSEEEQKEMQIEKIYINPGPFGDEVPMVHLDDQISNVEAWIPKTEEIEIGKYDFEKYFDLTCVVAEDPETGCCLYEISPKEEYKYCEFLDVEVYWSTIFYDEITGDQKWDYGPLELKIDGTETITWGINDTTEFTMGRFGKIMLKKYLENVINAHKW